MLGGAGSGKTLAYLLPIVNKLRADEEAGYRREPGKPRALILVPSRELVMQVAHVVKQLGHHAPLRAVALVGHRSVRVLRCRRRPPPPFSPAHPRRLCMPRTWSSRWTLWSAHRAKS